MMKANGLFRVLAFIICFALHSFSSATTTQSLPATVQNHTFSTICAKPDPVQFFKTCLPQRRWLSTRYRTIRLEKDEDVLKSYHLLVEYLRDPELASSVEELVYNKGKPRYSQCWYGEPEQIEHIGLREYSPERKEGEFLIQAFGSRLGLDAAAADELRDALRANISISDHHPRPGWQEKQRYFEAAAAMFLALCPNIRTLKLSPLVMRGPDLLDSFLLHNNYGQLSHLHLQKLRNIYIIHDPRWVTSSAFQPVSLFLMLQLFHRLPEIERISISGMSVESDYEMYPRTSNISKIDFEHIEMGSGDMADLIRSSKDLEEVRISTGGKWARGYAMVFPKTVGKALLRHKQTLRVLDLDFDYVIYDGAHSTRQLEAEDRPDEYDEDDMEPLIHEYTDLDIAIAERPLHTYELPNDRKYGATIGSLRDFTGLTQLSIGIKMLLGDAHVPPFRLIHTLPPGLEELTLRGYRKGRNERHDFEVQELLKKMDELFPKLKSLKGITELVPNSEYPEDDESEYKWDRYWDSRVEKFEWVEADDYE